jgi:predicted GIY-YIG superfamily endonuclease
LQGPAVIPCPTIVYILLTVTDRTRYNTGVTSDVDPRVGFHNAGLSTHTADAVAWELVASLSFANSDGAIEFEKHSKSGSGRAFARRDFR